MRFRRLAAFSIVLLFTLCGCPALASQPAGAASAPSRPSPERSVFAMTDPAGDDHGPGGYTYPKDESFSPFAGLCDLTRFQISRRGGDVIFDVTFARITNPWRAPEGASHPRVDIYIDTRERNGSLDPWRPGANVRFAADAGWERLVRLAPWGDSWAVKAHEDNAARLAEPAVVEETAARPDPSRLALKLQKAGPATLRAVVPAAFLGEPRPNWRYCVLVGAFDAFGPDNYRPVTKAGGRWAFGGGDDGAVAPNVIDLLAPAFGPQSQERQLGSYDTASGRLAAIMPVRKGPGVLTARGAGLLALGAAILVVGGWRLFRRRTAR